VVSIVSEAMDLTERRQAEEALRQSQKIEAVGQLTGGIAHDFNNLLGGIIGSLELIDRRLAAGRHEGLERYTSNAMASAQRAAALTQRLLAFARRQPLDPKSVDVNALVRGMEELLGRTLGPSSRLELQFGDELWPVLCDANQLESALLNLAINARDAMPGGGQLRVQTSNVVLDESYARSQGGEAVPGPYVAISVSDTGCGIPPDIIAKVFDPFFTTKPLGQGTGLGLSMLYGFVRQSGGHARVSSEPGQGTVFTLYLPRQSMPVPAEQEDHAIHTSALAHTGTGETVLVVDDEDTVRMLIRETLEDLGYAVLEAEDGPSALAVLQTAVRVDLLLTDVGLPGLNGRQVADAARVWRPGLRVLFVTGYAHMADVAGGSALECGMELITKPFALDALGTKVRAMLVQDPD
jgi:nitrogen-specific signal transduction histidine kinase/ActR/RegA family two-component response regulator